MKIIACEQGTPEWLNARLGIPTASQFHRIITPKKGGLSKSADAYAAELIAERWLGMSLDSEMNALMERGGVLEQRAAGWYELATDTDTDKVGLCMLDDGSAACSPDRLVGQRGGLEIKCPSPAVHVQYVLGMDSVGEKYRTQVQGALWITGRDWWDTVSYCPGDIPNAIRRAERDEAFIPLIEEAVQEFNARLAALWARAVEIKEAA